LGDGNEKGGGKLERGRVKVTISSFVLKGGGKVLKRIQLQMGEKGVF